MCSAGSPHVRNEALQRPRRSSEDGEAPRGPLLSLDGLNSIVRNDWTCVSEAHMLFFRGTDWGCSMDQSTVFLVVVAIAVVAVAIVAWVVVGKMRTKKLRGRFGP